MHTAADEIVNVLINLVFLKIVFVAIFLFWYFCLFDCIVRCVEFVFICLFPCPDCILLLSFLLLRMLFPLRCEWRVHGP
jgi:hypothetical protein